MKRKIDNFKSIDEILEKYENWYMEFQVWWWDEEKEEYYPDQEFAFYDYIDICFKEYVTEDYNLEGYLTDNYITETFIDEEEKTIIIEYYEQ